MAKSSGKGKKLDRIASELAAVRRDLKKLAKQQADLASEIAKLSRARAAPARRPKAKPQARATSPAKKPSVRKAPPPRADLLQGGAASPAHAPVPQPALTTRR